MPFKGGRALSGHPGLSNRGGTNAGLVYIVSATGYPRAGRNPGVGCQPASPE